MRKKILSAAAGMILLVSLGACAGQATAQKSAAEASVSDASAQEISTSEVSVSEVSVSETSTAEASESSAEALIINDAIESIESSDAMPGGWNINREGSSVDDNNEAKAAFEKATEGIMGYTYELVACLGSQVVSGTNYAYLCKGTVVYPDAEPEYVIVIVYEDLDGNAQITAVNTFG